MSVTPLFANLVPAARESNPAVVAELESLLEMARAGELVGFACAVAFCGDLTSWRRAGRQTRSLLGVLELMKHEMCKSDLEQ